MKSRIISKGTIKSDSSPPEVECSNWDWMHGSNVKQVEFELIIDKKAKRGRILGRTERNRCVDEPSALVQMITGCRVARTTCVCVW
jgi:hypothetical protein